MIVDEDKMEGKTDEGSGEGVVGEVAGGEVVKVEDGEVVRIEDGEVVEVEDRDGDVMEGSTDTEEGVAMVEKDMADPEPVGKIVGRLDNDSTGEDEPPKTQTPSVPRGI